jgi:hypothetical protein
MIKKKKACPFNNKSLLYKHELLNKFSLHITPSKTMVKASFPLEAESTPKP